MAASPAQVARLAAGAAGGSAGVAAFDQAQSQVKASRDAATRSLQADAAQAGAPGALTSQLSGDIAGGADTTLGNLNELGSVAAQGQQSQTDATRNYLTEAGAALPLIRAEADRDLGQKIALLNAGRAHSAANGAPLSDAELRNRLLGQATANRQGVLGQAQQQFQVALQDARNHLAYSTSDQPEAAAQPFRAGITGNPVGGGGLLGNVVGDVTGAANQMAGGISQARVDDLARRRDAIYQTQHDAALQREQAIANLRNATYGPGIVAEAQKLGIGAGIDPARVMGILPPSYDQAYVSANEKLGLYQDPTKQSVTGTLLSPQDTAASLGWKPDRVKSAFDQNYLDFTDPATAAAVKSFAESSPNTGQYGTLQTNAVTGNPDFVFSPNGLAQAQKDFQGSATASRYAANVTADIIKSGLSAAAKGMDLNTWANALTPEARLIANQYPDAFKVAYAQLNPVFDYYQALRTRNATIPDTSGGTGFIDPNLAAAGS